MVTPFELPMKAIYWLLLRPCFEHLPQRYRDLFPIQSKQKYLQNRHLLAVEAMYVMPSTPFISSSSGITTLFNTVSALAPV
jgi:hypothetical protein